MNEAARTLVARSARTAASTMAWRLQYGATEDNLLDEAWNGFKRIDAGPVDPHWDGVDRYFATVFVNTLAANEPR